MRNNHSNFVFTLLAAIFICVSCKREANEIKISSEDYNHLVDRITEIMIHDVFSPPVASRIYAYPNIAAYEALNGGSKKYKSLSGQLNGLKLKNPEKTDNVNKKLASLIAHIQVSKELIFSKDKLEVYKDSLYKIWKETNPTIFKKSKEYATQYSKQILEWMNKDNYSQTRTYPEHNGNTDDPSQWKPTPPAYMDAIEPHWNKIRPFTLDSASQFKPIPPPKFSLEKNSPFYKELIHVYKTGQQIIQKGDSSEEIEIARFWDCNPYVSVNKGHFMFASKKITPGAHWMGICKIACKKDNADFYKTIYAHTRTSISIADAFISCWDEKYRSNLVRPETLINKYIDETWEPILQTPPFPEYTSGHSVVSGAASETLTLIFGDNFNFLDTTEVPFGLPARKFSSFRSAAKEAAISRLYGGIHYKSAIELGLSQGILMSEHHKTKISYSYQP
ncbi:vanadium-dependent haloperoxidase [Tenacibaculum jejuense]|uniref:Phosphoesterase, PA-phosphatase related protein n=1 Tax=Tenacibaculum jejuense TaxID=584609 RepID=A0A238UD05_9FLAO|nr:vanadium-dependent haloperoxidase [Tenacibaculum jejuense]SNR17087.1 Phosphoesterase, PA-phosphatase related protein [Tenacibaculum jejuense]